jgi:alpha-N-arabinofuranosidase
VPFLKLAAVHDEPAGKLTLFALNRSLGEELPLELHAKGFEDLRVERALELRDDDLQATNTKAAPGRIVPRPLASLSVEDSRLQATLAPASWNVIRLAGAR